MRLSPGKKKESQREANETNETNGKMARNGKNGSQSLKEKAIKEFSFEMGREKSIIFCKMVDLLRVFPDLKSPLSEWKQDPEPV